MERFKKFFRSNYVFIVLFLLAFAITAFAFQSNYLKPSSNQNDAAPTEQVGNSTSPTVSEACPEECQSSCEGGQCPSEAKSDQDSASTGEAKSNPTSSNQSTSAPSGSTKSGSSSTSVKPQDQPETTATQPASSGCPITGGKSCPGY